MPSAERRNIILPADRAETHLDVYFYIICTPSPVRGIPDFHEGLAGRREKGEKQRARAAYTRLLHERSRRVLKKKIKKIIIREIKQDFKTHNIAAVVYPTGCGNIG